MSVERWIRLIAGCLVTVSLALGWWVSPWFLLVTAFVGVNLLQSALTRWCLMEDILIHFGVGQAAPAREGAASQDSPAAV